MVTRRQGLQMKGGVQLPMFAVEVEPEPATVAGPARPAAAERAEAHGLELQTGPQSPIGDRSAEPEVDR